MTSAIPVTFLGNYHPAGVTRFILLLAQDIVQISNRVWALKDVPVNYVENIRGKAIDILSNNLARMRLKYLVNKIDVRLKAEYFRVSFIEACLRTCNRLLITDHGWCLLPKWQHTYVDDIVEILRNAHKPMHYRRIAAELSELFGSFVKISIPSIHNILLRFKKIFALNKLTCPQHLVHLLS